MWPFQGTESTESSLCGRRVSQKDFPKEVPSKLRPAGRDGVIEESSSSKRTSMREVLEARKDKMNPVVAKLEQRVGVGSELGSGQERPYSPT